MSCALAEGETIRVVSAAAGRAGVRAGMSVPEARVYCAELVVREWDARAVTDAVMAMTGQLLQCSPQVTSANGAPGTWWVGASGFDHVGGEDALGALLLQVARTWHPGARVAIADSCVAARAATWAPQASREQSSREPSSREQVPRASSQALESSTTSSRSTGLTARGSRGGAENAENNNGNGNNNGNNNKGYSYSRNNHRNNNKRDDGGNKTGVKKNDSALTIVPVGTCAHYLAPAPLGLVPMTEELREALQSLGLRTVGSLAALAPGDVERRWGAEGIGAWRLAHGDDPRRPGLVRTEMARSASAELASATDNMAPLLFLIRSALNRLVQQLLHDGRAAASVAVTLSLDARPQHTITREIRPARPLARVAPLFDQCRALLEKWTLEAPVYAVTVSIPATAPLTADQGDLLVPSWRDAASTVDAVFVRLRAALEANGINDVVVRPVFGNAHRPELAGRWEAADALRMSEYGATADLRNGRLTAETATAATTAATAATATAGKGLTAEKSGLTAETATEEEKDTFAPSVASVTTASGGITLPLKKPMGRTTGSASTVARTVPPLRVFGASPPSLSAVRRTPPLNVFATPAPASPRAASGLSVPRTNTPTEPQVLALQKSSPPLSVFGRSSSTTTSPHAQTTDTSRLATVSTKDDASSRVNPHPHSGSVATHTQPVANPASAALRLLEKPERVVVQVLSGAPRQVTWRDRRITFASVHGPERLSGDWWRPDTFARDYWRCTVAGEGELLIYRDNTGWFVQGWYD